MISRIRACTALNEINLPYRFSLRVGSLGLISDSNPIIPQLVLDEARLSMIANYILRTGIGGPQGPLARRAYRAILAHKAHKAYRAILARKDPRYRAILARKDLLD